MNPVCLINHRQESALSGLWHDYANLFPMLDAAGQDALRADIQQHGVHEPVIVFDGRILDGRNRYMAAHDLGLDFPVADFDGTDAEALAYVLSTNLHRRHLTESQRAAVAAKLANMTKADAGRMGAEAQGKATANLPEPSHPVSNSQAADMLNVSERSVRTAKTVIEQGAPELVAAVESGAVSVSAAAAVSELPKDEQAATVAEGPRAVKAKAKSIRQKKAAPESAVDQPEDDKIDRKLRLAFRKLTAQAQEDDWVGLKRAIHDEAKKRRAIEAENRKLKESLKLYRHQDQNAVIRALEDAKRNAENAQWRSLEEQQRQQKQIFALKKRVEELEGMEIQL